MRRSKTHFEQIPVEIVKKIATELPASSVVPGKITPPQINWRELAKQVQQEQDPKKMAKLVTQLLDEFDAGDFRKGQGSVPTKRL